MDKTTWSRVVEVADAGANSAMRRLLRLPSFFDAVIDENDESCTDNDASKQLESRSTTDYGIY